MTKTLQTQLAPIPVNTQINHVDSKTSLEEHIDSDSLILTTNVAMLLNTFPQLETLEEITKLSDQVMKVLTKRRELCLKPTCIAETEDSEVNITPVK